MSELKQASCCCGKLKVHCQGEPIRASVCHCYQCQKRTGNVFGTQARFSVDKVEIEGISKEYVRTGDSGNKINFHFCPDCGSTVYWYLESLPDFIIVTVGAFADKDFQAPVISIYEDRMHGWVNFNHMDIEHIP